MKLSSLCSLSFSAATIVFCGCASPEATIRTSVTDSPGQFVGWVRFVGEFVLYSDRVAFDGFRRERCISGALPLERQRDAAKRLNGKRVRVIAKKVPWALPDPLAVSLNNQGSPITNWCGEKYVLFATDMAIE